MLKRLAPLLAILLIAGPTAHAQSSGGGHGHGSRGGHQGGGSNLAPTTDSTPTHAQTPLDQVEIVGVVKTIGPEPDRITIAYGAVEGLNWPAGTMPFTASKPELLKGASVGQRSASRWKATHISEFKPF